MTWQPSKICTFRNLVRRSTFRCILAALWLPLASLLAPFGSLLPPFGPLWTTFWHQSAHIWYPLVHFCSPQGSIFSLLNLLASFLVPFLWFRRKTNKKIVFWDISLCFFFFIPDSAKHLQDYRRRHFTEEPFLLGADLSHLTQGGTFPWVTLHQIIYTDILTQD